MLSLILQIEAFIFSSAQAVSANELLAHFTENNTHAEIVTLQDVADCLALLTEKYQNDLYSFELKNVGGGYQFLSKPDYHEVISIFLNQKSKKKLSTSALETLSIIAYKQPISKAEIEQIRGVNADYSVHKLLEKELIVISGKSDKPGKPILYSVSQYFLDYFGINSIEDMPKLQEIIPENDNHIGENQ